ncbi:protease HtpX [Ahniella affigens]|uniref:Protease HtpX n=1 Tax=Ahniella affigens TaxID=2021234 RepID=A0A2P1PTC8_9GAMM|nr:protease HtpX [Ahniella affigens]AVP98105.1 protease HtpX [Ahniella affigens]
MLRILLFVGTNLAIMLVLGLVLSITGIGRQSGLGGLLLISAVIGFTGSIISLLMSKTIAKWQTGATIITQPRNEAERWLLTTVARQAEQAGIGMPDVAIYQAPEMNAFATGWNRNAALVAVSTGLLSRMTRDEVEAVLGHEVSHVANGDMVTLTLIQGVLNTFVVFLSSILARIVAGFMQSREDESNGFATLVYHVVHFLAQIVFGILASVIVMWFSRRREFRADAGGAALASRRSMINALRRLGGDQYDSTLPEGTQAMGISGARRQMARLFMSHPPIGERIAALEAAA